MRIICRPLSVLLSTILAAASFLEAQTTNPPGVADLQELHLNVVQGESATSTSANADPGITVLVTDGQDAPVANAAVLFRLPSEEPTGNFADGSRVAVLYTDLAGRATISNIHWSSATGTASIRVIASKGDVHAGLIVEQALRRSSTGKLNASDTKSADPAQTASAAVPASAPVEPPAKPQQPAQPKQEGPAPVLTAANLPPLRQDNAPAVSVNTNPGHQVTGASGASRKWLWIGLTAAAAAGAAFALTSNHKSSTSTAATSQTTVGSPSINIGHP